MPVYPGAPKNTEANFKISFARRNSKFSFAQLADLLALRIAQQIAAPPLVRLDAAHMQAQRLSRDTQISSDVRNRPARLEHQPRAALQQLQRVLPRSWHQRSVSSPQDRTPRDQGPR
jgi:hypothetical protein